MSDLLPWFFPFLTFLVTLPFVKSLPRGLPHMQLEQHHVNIDLERNRFIAFKYVPLETQITGSWKHLLEPPADPSPEFCTTSLEIDLSLFEFPTVTLCFFRENWEKHARIFAEDAKIQIFQDNYSPKSLYTETQGVTGYVKSNPNSKVTGFINNGNFYGQIRLFDLFRLHHVVFYVEPSDNLELYPAGATAKDMRKKRAAGNAILFEHIVRDDEEIPPDADNFDDNVVTKKRKKRQTKDQEHYSHDNIQQKDRDVIHSFKFKAGLTDHSIFDTRRDDTYICNLCIWLQPNFAQKFSLGGSVQHGAAEVIDLIKLLNWIFRALDFDEDGLAENVGFVISNLIINDNIRVTTTEAPEEHPGKPSEDGSSPKYSFSTNSNSITAKSALALATKHLEPVCKSSCATLAFVYHNMAPAISATNLRGLCTNRNIAVISGSVLSYKIAKYDVFRGLFHAVGHLFGAHHDDVTNARCIGTLRQRFLNPFLMHPIQQLNVGVRPSSFRMSPCTKDHVTQFLSSNGIGCLEKLQNDTFCGNGFVEDGEECDCGSLWQCHLQEECCGESDTVSGCSVINPYKTQCLRPRVW